MESSSERRHEDGKNDEDPQRQREIKSGDEKNSESEVLDGEMQKLTNELKENWSYSFLSQHIHDKPFMVRKLRLKPGCSMLRTGH